MAENAARQPGPTITKTQLTSADKEGAFRFLENHQVESSAVALAAFQHTSLRCGEEGRVYVAIDQTVLQFVDRNNVRGLGPAHNRISKFHRSMQCMNALALDASGTPLGLLAQEFWNRPEEKTPYGKGDPRPSEERESWRWVEALRHARQQLSDHAPNARACYVMDRGADFFGVWSVVDEHDLEVTMRCCYDRAIEKNGAHRRLFATLRRQPVVETVRLHVPRGPNRMARTAKIELRKLRAKVRLRTKFQKGGELWKELTIVQAREVGHVPNGEQRILWRIYSTVNASASALVKTYKKRWRIEEFHKTWKTGACKVEHSQLRSFEALRRWATILAAVASRVERLKVLSREQPDLDALEEFSQDELDAAIMLTETKKHQPGDSLTLKEAVRLVAMIGGHMGYPSAGPPGSLTIRRGLERVEPAGRVLKAARSSG